MHRDYFPPCRVDGSILPAVPYSVGFSRGAVPSKCSTCRHLFEGGCTRIMETTPRYLHLDHGPCGVRGPTDPVSYDDRFVAAKVTVPRKCASCVHLVLDLRRGFQCGQDRAIWGDFHRGLDWGTWSPPRFELALPPPTVTTEAMVDAVHDDDLLAFIREAQRVNPGISIADIRTAFASLRALVAGP